jgi:streptogramin lyase
MMARHVEALLAVVLLGCGCGEGKGGGRQEGEPLCTDLREGCACDAPAPVSCYEGAESVEDVGVCAPGLRYCLDAMWGPCEGQVYPRDEVCGDELDNDCDGQADEAGRCGCRDGCTEQGADCFVDARIAGLVEAGQCALTLETREVAIGDAWIANTQDSSVSRIDTIRGVEIARYASVNDGPHGAPSPTVACDPDQVVANAPTGNCPSRTSVASNGDAFVANRAFGSQGTVSRIAGHPDRCVDSNGNGVLDTSADLDGDGTISTDPADGEYLGDRDECLLWTVPVGEPGDVPRALAVAPSDDPGRIGEVWVGLFFSRRALALDPETGHELARVNLDVQPYGAAASHDGRIWFTETDWSSAFGLQAVDSATHSAEAAIEPPVVDGCMGSYGIAIDEHGRVWRGAHPCTGVFRYDPVDGRWTRFAVADNGASLGVTADGDGHVWAVFFRDANRAHVARVARFDAETGVVDRSWDLTGTIEDPWGVGLDGEGDAWIVSRGSDRALEIDAETGETRAVPTGDEPYTYSDFTGYQLDLVTDRTGYADLVFEGCDEGTDWFDVTVDAAVPDGARLEVFVKSADHAEALEATPWRGPMAAPADVRDEHGLLLAVRVQLWAAEDPHTPLPILRDVSAAHLCPDVAE